MGERESTRLPGPLSPRRPGAGGDTAPALHLVRLPGARDLTPLARQWSRGRRLAWLDSSQGHPSRGRYSTLCEVGRTGLVLGRSCRHRDAEPDFAGRARAAFERSRRGRREARNQAPAGPFLGGWVGFLAYEAQIDMDAAFPDRPALLPYPRVWFREALRGVTVAHAQDETWLWAWVRDGEDEPDLAAWERKLSDHRDAPADEEPLEGWALPTEPLDPRWHGAAVRDVLERIRAGELYQVNLTAPVPVRVGPDPLAAYLRLRRTSPGDFAAYLAWPGLTVLASSPEEFVTVRQGRVLARPMKGTRPRGVDGPTDARLRAELAASPKDRAENVMIVDLVRNDLGRVAETGTVSVTALCEVESYATVHQLTSTIEGQLREGEDVFGVLAALFPPGSMTGAPKIQATRVIRTLEPVPRGLYSGCLGAVDWNGDAVFAVVIRSLVAHPRGASWAVGGGIVADSDPEAELEEARAKLVALVKTLERAS
jgi:anthranilate/para-aminobenzoate synthase component I